MGTIFFINRFTIMGRGTQVNLYLKIMKLRMKEFSIPRRFFTFDTNSREHQLIINRGQ